MPAKSRQTHVKRARELALRERRERKQAKKDARNAERRAQLDGTQPPEGEDEVVADGEVVAEGEVAADGEVGSPDDAAEAEAKD